MSSAREAEIRLAVENTSIERLTRLYQAVLAQTFLDATQQDTFMAFVRKNGFQKMARRRAGKHRYRISHDFDHLGLPKTMLRGIKDYEAGKGLRDNPYRKKTKKQHLGKFWSFWRAGFFLAREKEQSQNDFFLWKATNRTKFGRWRCDKVEARDFLLNDETGFETLCQFAGFKPDYVRMKVKNIAANGWKKPADIDARFAA